MTILVNHQMHTELQGIEKNTLKFNFLKVILLDTMQCVKPFLTPSELQKILGDPIFTHFAKNTIFLPCFKTLY